MIFIFGEGSESLERCARKKNLRLSSGHSFDVCKAHIATWTLDDELGLKLLVLSFFFFFPGLRLAKGPAI